MKKLSLACSPIVCRFLVRYKKFKEKKETFNSLVHWSWSLDGFGYLTKSPDGQGKPAEMDWIKACVDEGSAWCCSLSLGQKIGHYFFLLSNVHKTSRLHQSLKIYPQFFLLFSIILLKLKSLEYMNHSSWKNEGPKLAPNLKKTSIDRVTSISPLRHCSAASLTFNIFNLFAVSQPQLVPAGLWHRREVTNRTMLQLGPSRVRWQGYPIPVQTMAQARW